jgi:hypothetical protein
MLLPIRTDTSSSCVLCRHTSPRPACCASLLVQPSGCSPHTLTHHLLVQLLCRHTDNEPKAGLLRIVAAGGRASEPREPGPGGVGAVAVGTRTLSEGGAVGDWSREQVWCMICSST